MGLIHTPRMIYSIVRGLLKRRIEGGSGASVGLGVDNPHIYSARLGLVDIDYLGHMNNAAYLSHAEYARWDLVGQNGMLTAMYKNNVFFLVAGTTIRFRRELRPMFRKFQIDTAICALDSRNIWISHKFRYPGTPNNPESRVLAQIMIQGVAVKGRDVVNPADFLKECEGMDPDLIDRLILPDTKDAQESNIAATVVERYLALEDSFKIWAAEDDKRSAS